jgi:hypothetical protein
MRTNATASVPGSDGGLAGLVGGVNRFFFEPGDTATLGLVRICAGILILYVHLIYSYDLYTLLGKDAWINYDLATDYRDNIPIARSDMDWQPQKLEHPPLKEGEEKQLNDYRRRWLNNDPGLDPRDLWAQGTYTWSVWYHVTDPSWMAVVHAGILVCMLLFTLGLWTPVTGFVTWMGVLSYVNRAHTTFFGMDSIMNVLVIYLTLAHLFAQPGTLALSLDRLLWRRRLSLTGVVPGDDTESSSATFALRMMQIHFCIIYLASGLSKLQGAAWWNGTAVWRTAANPELSALHLKYYHDFIVWLCQHRALWEVSMTASVAFTLALEISFPFLVWVPRLRWLMVIGSVLLHTGIALGMGLTIFSLMMLALLVSFIPAATVRQLLGLAERVPSLVPAPALAPAEAVRA